MTDFAVGAVEELGASEDDPAVDDGTGSSDDDAALDVDVDERVVSGRFEGKELSDALAVEAEEPASEGEGESVDVVATVDRSVDVVVSEDETWVEDSSDDVWSVT